jgi:pimeloyl-ACP methyl ester carboxylesterase
MASSVLLVHGAWHGAWCFERILGPLTDAGIEARAIDLPGHGDDPGPFTDLHGDATRVASVLDDLGDDVVLVGHSYGGAVITEAGVHPAVRHLVYLCAFPIDAGESCALAATEHPEIVGLSHEGRPNLADGFEVHVDGTITLTTEGAAACLYNGCDDRTVEWALAHLGPHPMVNLNQVPTAVAWRERPSTYAVCTDDMAVHPQLQRVLANRCTDSVDWATDHSPFLSHPGLVVDLLVELAGDATGSPSGAA